MNFLQIKMRSEINAILLAMITTIIGLISIYYPNYRNQILIFASITFIGYILFIYLSRIQENQKEISELKKVLKRSEDLIELRGELESLKKEVRNEK